MKICLVIFGLLALLGAFGAAVHHDTEPTVLAPVVIGTRVLIGLGWFLLAAMIAVYDVVTKASRTIDEGLTREANRMRAALDRADRRLEKLEADAAVIRRAKEVEHHRAKVEAGKNSS